VEWTPIPLFSTSFIFSPERIMVGGGVIGSLVTIWLGSAKQRRLALGVVLAETGFIAVGRPTIGWIIGLGRLFGISNYICFPISLCAFAFSCLPR
jgi:hypothetical protein